MVYIISDIHGCYDEYMELLQKINFRDRDTLYVLGDVLDRGPHPVKVLQDMMMRPNVFPIIGNHDYIALMMLRKLNVQITEENAENHLDEKDIEDYMRWLQDGGETTIQEFAALDMEEREDILEYLEEEFSMGHEFSLNGKEFVLVHAGLHDFSEEKELDDYSLEDVSFHRTDYKKRYYSSPKKYLVTGHTPVMAIRKDKQALVYEENGHIALDCGCVFGGKLAAYCVDSGESYYVETRRKKR